MWTLVFLILAIGGHYNNEHAAVCLGLIMMFVVNLGSMFKYIYFRVMMCYKPGISFRKDTNEIVITGNQRKYEEMLRGWREIEDKY